jgi:hypothetical protein
MMLAKNQSDGTVKPGLGYGVWPFTLYNLPVGVSAATKNKVWPDVF